jgi:hypothetical protein
MDEILRMKHLHEQRAYEEIRAALVEEFVADPEGFMHQFGSRPEDLSGQQLREFYPHYLASGRTPQDAGSPFARRFLSGGLFPILQQA